MVKLIDKILNRFEFKTKTKKTTELSAFTPDKHNPIMA